VLGVLAGIVGTWQANEVLKLLLGVGTPLVGRLLLIDALTARMREIALARDPRCALCGEEPSITDVCETLAPSRCESAVAEIDACDLDAFLERYPEAVVLDVREAREAASDAPTASVYIPASVLPARLHELDSAKTYVVACRLGSISRWATALLRDAGFTRLLHLRNGLSAYAVKERDEFHAWE
jgi:adenylyltransferase/sulfurtransferase